jgi:2-hydroxychromene-2-carboxylate isomerase
MTGFEFWFSIGSTYTFLTVQRIDAAAATAGIDITWRPFSVRQIMQEMNNVPFVGKPVKERYMWRDLQRRAERLGITLEVPVAYPLEHFDRANRVAILASHEGWCEAYVKATYRYWMLEGLPAGGEPNLRTCCYDLDQSYERVLDAAAREDIEASYRESTAAARKAGIFGSPSFVVGGTELFWGDDRLEDAIEFWQQVEIDGQT